MRFLLFWLNNSRYTATKSTGCRLLAHEYLYPLFITAKSESSTLNAMDYTTTILANK